MSDQPNAIVLLTPDIAIQRAKDAYQIVKEMRDKVLVKDIDFGAVPGTEKPTLLKPGAEKLCRAFGYNDVLETVSKVERWDDDSPLFHYEIRCRLIRIEDGKEIATGLASCNSKENRYRWRWVSEEDLPPQLDKSKLKTRSTSRSEFDFAIQKAETSGKYGKPAEYWGEWKQAIENGTARKIQKPTRNGTSDAWEMGSVLYRIPNDEVFTLVNTIEKMACKRALVAAVLIGTNASEFFTQDMEDLRDFGGDVVEGEFEVIKDVPASTPQQPQPATPAASQSPTSTTPPKAVNKADWTGVWQAFKDAGFNPQYDVDVRKVFGVNGTLDLTQDQAIEKIKNYQPATYGGGK